MDFAGNTGCYSAFVVWSRSAIGMFVDAFSKQVREVSRPRGVANTAALKDDESSVENSISSNAAKSLLMIIENSSM